MVLVNFVIPVIILSVRRFRTITGCVIASVGVVVGMWLERYLIVVPSLAHKYLPYSWGTYSPRPTEIVITAATFAAMALLYTLFAKFVPIISIWEMKAGEHPRGRPDRRRRAAARGDPRMKAVYALYSTGDAAQRAVNSLRAAGYADDDITVISGAPMEEYEFSHIGRHSYQWYIACGGGLSDSCSAPGSPPSPRMTGRSSSATCRSSPGTRI